MRFCPAEGGGLLDSTSSGPSHRIGGSSVASWSLRHGQSSPLLSPRRLFAALPSAGHPAGPAPQQTRQSMASSMVPYWAAASLADPSGKPMDSKSDNMALRSPLLKSA